MPEPGGVRPRELVFALEFRGTAWALPGSTTKRRAKTTAWSQALSSVLGPEGVAARVERLTGEHAVLESEVERRGDGTFVEAGTIAFETVGQGIVGPSPVAGWQRGAVIWVVTGGEGRFAGARGVITSNFTVSAGGEVIDNHFARLYLPA